MHRDFKPDNVIVQKVGPDRSPSGRRVQVLDFGLAQVRETQESEPSGHSGRRTRPDEHPEPAVGRVGTPGYMVPEQHLGLQASVHADQFSFCICLYEALCRRTPFYGAGTSKPASSRGTSSTLTVHPRCGPTTMPFAVVIRSRCSTRSSSVRSAFR